MDITSVDPAPLEIKRMLKTMEIEHWVIPDWKYVNGKPLRQSSVWLLDLTLKTQ